MADKTDATIVDEVEKRLDDLFGDGDAAAGFGQDQGDIEEPPTLEKDSSDVEEPLAMEKDRVDVEDSPLKELKSIVLSIDWEITDEIMIKFLTQVNGLKKEYQGDKIIQMFLQLLGSVGKYIKAKKANADPDVVKLLSTAYAGLEKVTLTEGIAETNRKKLLLTEVNKFKKLKERLTKKAAPKRKEVVSPPKEERPVVEEREEIVEAKEEISVPAPEAEKEEEPVVVGVAAISGSKGLGVGSKVVLIVLLPLIIVAAVGYLYISQLTGLTSQIDQVLQTFSGASVEEAKNIVLTLLCGLVILIGLIAALYGSKLAGKIKYLTNVVERINAGEIDAAIEIKSGGEIGALSEAINRMRENLR